MPHTFGDYVESALQCRPRELILLVFLIYLGVYAVPAIFFGHAAEIPLANWALTALVFLLGANGALFGIRALLATFSYDSRGSIVQTTSGSRLAGSIA